MKRSITHSSEHHVLVVPMLNALVAQPARLLQLIAISFALLGASQFTFAADGKALFESTCIACHGANLKGAIPGVPDLNTSGRLAQSDEVLIDHIVNGFQSKGSSMAMPAKGGNPGLSMEDVRALVFYMHSVTTANNRPSSSTGLSESQQTPTNIESSEKLADAPSSPPEATAFSRGTSAWANNCHRCHNVIDPKRLSDNQWRVVLAHMRLRAGLDGQSQQDILQFLQGGN